MAKIINIYTIKSILRFLYLYGMICNKEKFNYYFTR